MTYLLDTNIFITAKNELPMDVYPSFWQVLSQLAANGEFRSVKKVEDEIRKGKDELVDWIDDNLPADFFHPNSHIARYAPLSDERKSLENTLKKFTKLFFNRC